MSPVMTDEPVLVMALPANTAYVDAVARLTVAVAALALGTTQKKAAAAVKVNANRPLDRDLSRRALRKRLPIVDLCGVWTESP
jgi:hypothetical protein